MPPVPSPRRPSISLVVAALALFVALGGPAEAQRLLSGSDIKKGTITSKQVKDRSLEAADLSAKARRGLTAPGGLDHRRQARRRRGHGALARAGERAQRRRGRPTLTADDLAANAVGTEELGDNAVGQAEIRNNGVGASEITNDSIDGGEIIDGGLLARDVALFSGTLEARFPTSAPSDCVTAPGDGHGGGPRTPTSPATSSSSRPA